MDKEHQEEIEQEIIQEKRMEAQHERETAIKDEWLKDNYKRLLKEYFENHKTFKEFNHIKSFFNSVWEEEKEDYI